MVGRGGGGRFIGFDRRLSPSLPHHHHHSFPFSWVLVMPPVPYLDQTTFHKLWSALPANRCDRGFWNGVEALYDPFLNGNCPLRSQEYFTTPHTGRVIQSEVHYLDEAVVSEGNGLRMMYDSFTLWNPFALAALLKIPIAVVVEQLLLAVEYTFMTMSFVVSCQSCAFDIKHFTTVADVPFMGTYHSRNAFRCPLCTDRTEVTSLSAVSVFFQLQRLHPVFQRSHHRSFVTDQADKRRLETFFCPAGAGFTVPLHLPRGKYLLCAPFMASMVEIEAQTSAASLGEREPFLTRVVELKNYCIEPASNRTNAALKMGRGKNVAGANGNAGGTAAGAQSYGGFQGRRSIAAPPQRRILSHRASRVGGVGKLNPQDPSSDGEDDDGNNLNGFGLEEVEEIAPTQCVVLKHGKVQLRVYNSTASSGFIDLYVKFDRRVEFSAVKYPKQFLLPDLLHSLPRGLRSRHLVSCTPLPPAEVPTKGVFVRHYFDFEAIDFIDAQILAVVREVHRYSLEDQQGLLLGVSNGGTTFECTFLTVTAALASSICFFQRVLVRLEEGIALALRTSITEGPLCLSAYQGQYNDTDNARSAYPDVQFVGPVMYASNHPPVVAPSLYATMVEAPTPPVSQRMGAAGGHEISEFRAALCQEEFDLMMAAAAAKEAANNNSIERSFMPWLDNADEHVHSRPTNEVGKGGAQSPSQQHRARRQSEASIRRHKASVTVTDGQTIPECTETMARFELRSVPRLPLSDEVSVADLRLGSVPLKENYASGYRQQWGDSVNDGSPFFGEESKATNRREDDDVVLPYFLKYLVEQLEGARVVEERHALVVMVPMSVIHAAVQLSNMLDRSSYIKEYLGPF